MFFPAESYVSLSARIAGASRAAVALGEFVPVLAAVALVAAGTAIGSNLFISQTASSPITAFAGLEALVTVDVLVVLLVNQIFVAACRALGVPEGVARIAGLIAGVGLISTLLGNLLNSILSAQTSWMSEITQMAWGSDMPLSVPSAAVTIVAALVLLVALFAVLALTPGSRTIGVGNRLFSIPLIGKPSRYVNFVVREALLTLRHPVSQLSIASAAILAALLVVGCRMGLVPVGITTTGLAALFSTGVESAFGRMLPWGWVLRQMGMRARLIVAAQIVGATLIGAVFFVIALLVAAPGVATTSLALLEGLVQLGLFSIIAYASGVVAPYDRTAPLGMLLTSVIAIVVDGAVYWVISTFVPSTGAFVIVCQFIAIGILIPTCIGLVGWRMRRVA